MTNLITHAGSAPDPTEDPLEAAFAAMAEEVRANFGDPAYRYALAAQFARVIYEGFEHENLVDLFANVHRVAPGDEILIEEVRGLKVHWVARGGQIDASEITEMVWRLPEDQVGFALDELIENFLSGFQRRARALIDMAISQLDAEVNRRLFALYLATVNDSSPFYTEGDGLSKTWLRRSVTQIKDKTRKGASGVVIAGRATMTDQIMDILEDDNMFVPETNEAILQRGMLGRYRGAAIVELKNFEDADGNARIPASDLIVAGADNLEVGFWGGLKTIDEIQRWYWHYEGVRTVGMAVRKPEYIRRFHDTGIDAETGEDLASA